MKRTLVLAVDRDDDFGVKGGVISPVVGLDNCLSAANALGIADPEDSDLNALYAAISTCIEMQNDGFEVEVALICGNAKVGHKSDLTLVNQLEMVLDQIQPDNVVLVGDGAEDEYIYPIISSRSHVDSVRKVFVKQAPNIESSFYVITKMLSEPNKKKRFIAPIGYIVILFSVFMMIPDIVLLSTSKDVGSLSNISRDIILMIIGIAIVSYAYNFSDRWSNFTTFVRDEVFSRSTRLITITIAIGIVIIAALFSYNLMSDMYFKHSFVAFVYFLDLMVWPAIIAVVVYIIGVVQEEYQNNSTLHISNIYYCVTLGCFAMVLMGLLDIILSNFMPDISISRGVIEIILGFMVSMAVSFVKRHYNSAVAPPVI